MIHAFDPPDAPKPASAYSQGVVYEGPARRLIISGQVGVDFEGRILEGFEAQVRQAFANLEAVLRGAEMTMTDVVKITVFVTRSDVIGPWRGLRDAALRGHKPASTYLQVAGLAHPDFLVEIEAEAVQEIS
ncbi:MAG: RidA family protein [Labrys sp. (in: a-proteobacteria)]|jgi:2-iminobutanoate/2-iminopropanoate deaminase